MKIKVHEYSLGYVLNLIIGKKCNACDYIISDKDDFYEVKIVTYKNHLICFFCPYCCRDKSNDEIKDVQERAINKFVREENQ